MRIEKTKSAEVKCDPLQITWVSLYSICSLESLSTACSIRTAKLGGFSAKKLGCKNSTKHGSRETEHYRHNGVPEG